MTPSATGGAAPLRSGMNPKHSSRSVRNIGRLCTNRRQLYRRWEDQRPRASAYGSESDNSSLLVAIPERSSAPPPLSRKKTELIGSVLLAARHRSAPEASAARYRGSASQPHSSRSPHHHESLRAPRLLQSPSIAPFWSRHTAHTASSPATLRTVSWVTDRWRKTSSRTHGSNSGSAPRSSTLRAARCGVCCSLVSVIRRSTYGARWRTSWAYAPPDCARHDDSPSAR